MSCAKQPASNNLIGASAPLAKEALADQKGSVVRLTEPSRPLFPRAVTGTDFNPRFTSSISQAC